MNANFEVVPRTEIGAAEWDARCLESDDAWLWHTHAFQDALATWPGIEDRSFGLRDGSGELVAIVPVRLITTRRRGPGRAINLDSLGGPATTAVALRQRRNCLRFAHAELLNVGRITRARSLSVALPPLAPRLRSPDAPRVNPMLEYGFQNSLTQTWMVRLGGRTIEQIWAGLEGRARTAIRKAEKAGLSCRAASGEADLAIYVDLHRQTCERNNIPPHPPAYFASIWRLAETGLAHILLAEREGRVVAARNFGIYKQGALTWTAAGNSEGSQLGANNLLQWRAMEWMAQAGIEYSESGEAFPGARDSKAGGLSRFKASFGGDLVPFYRGSMDLRSTGARRRDLIGELGRRAPVGLRNGA